MILVDTTPLVALCDSRDSYHGRAVRHLQGLMPSAFGVCEAVLAEACFHLSSRSERLRLRELLVELNAVAVGDTDHRYRAEVFDWLVKYAEHDPDWADGCLAILSGRDGSAKVWTYDREFQTTWRRPDGSRIPLVMNVTA